MSAAGPVYVWWAAHSRVYHFRPTCGMWHIYDHRESDLAVLALPKLRREGRHACVSCVRAGRLRQVADGHSQGLSELAEHPEAGRLGTALPSADGPRRDPEKSSQFGLGEQLRHSALSEPISVHPDQSSTAGSVAEARMLTNGCLPVRLRV